LTARDHVQPQGTPYVKLQLWENGVGIYNYNFSSIGFHIGVKVKKSTVSCFKPVVWEKNHKIHLYSIGDRQIYPQHINRCRNYLGEAVKTNLGETESVCRIEGSVAADGDSL